MKTLKQTVDELNELIVQFKFEEALDKFYHNDVISVENESAPTVGLPAYRVSARKYIDSVSNYSAQLKNMIVSNDMSVCEWHYKFDHEQWGKWDTVQLSVQRWKDGKIMHERHHYKTQ